MLCAVASRGGGEEAKDGRQKSLGRTSAQKFDLEKSVAEGLYGSAVQVRRARTARLVLPRQSCMSEPAVTHPCTAGLLALPYGPLNGLPRPCAAERWFPCNVKLRMQVLT